VIGSSRDVTLRNFAWTLPVVALVWLAGPASGAADDAEQRGLALATRAAQLQELRSADSPPFRLHAHVKLLGLVVGTREGDYTLTFGSPEQWSERISFPGYEETNGVWEGKHWRKRSSVDRPYRFLEVMHLLDVGRHVRIPAASHVLKLSQRQTAGQQDLCIEAAPTRDVWERERENTAAIGELAQRKDIKYTLCFEGASGALREAEYALPLPRFVYEGSVPLGNKAFPERLRCFEGKDLVVDASVDLLSPIESFNAASVAPPAGATSWPVCDAASPPRLLAKSEADNTHAKANRVFGTVVFYAEVGIDGSLHDLTSVQARGAALVGGVQDAVANWRYAPAECRGTPVPFDIYLAYTFLP